MSDFTITELLIFQLALILLNAVFACAEIAVISTNETKLKKLAYDGNRNASRLLELMQQPARFLATIQVGITLAGFLGSAFAADNFSDKIVDWLISLGATMSPAKLDVLSVIGITLILSYVTLILGELVPKRIAMRNAEKIGLFCSGMLLFIAKLFAPLVWLLTLSTNIVLRLCGIDPNEKDEKITQEEIRIMIDAGNENGAIDDIEKDIIHNVFEFDNKQTSEVMTHRTKVVFLNMDDDLSVWEKTMIKTRHSIYPIYENNSDNIVGTLSFKDYFQYKTESKETILKKAMKQPHFITGSIYIDDLFKNMQKTRQHFAIVVDEYGGMDGIVTMNDLLEEIVGDLEDDALAPKAEPLIEKINKNTWKIKGNAPIDKVAEKLGIEFPDDEYDTFAGFLLSLMGSIPMKKKVIKLTYKNMKIKITSVKKNRIEDTLVKVL